MTIQWSEACDSFAAHGDDDFAPVGDMSDVAAQVVMEFTHAHLVFEISLWRHGVEYKHHNGPGWQVRWLSPWLAATAEDGHRRCARS